MTGLYTCQIGGPGKGENRTTLRHPGNCADSGGVTEAEEMGREEGAGGGLDISYPKSSRAFRWSSYRYTGR